MARCPLVRPETARVTLHDGEWLDVKKELNAGEYRQMFVMQMKQATIGDDRLSVDLENIGINKILAYIVGWSFADFNGNPLPFSRETVEMLDQETFQEILRAVEAHHDDSEKAIEIRKNAQSGETGLRAISSSAA